MNAQVSWIIQVAQDVLLPFLAGLFVSRIHDTTNKYIDKLLDRLLGKTLREKLNWFSRRYWYLFSAYVILVLAIALFKIDQTPAVNSQPLESINISIPTQVVTTSPNFTANPTTEPAETILAVDNEYYVHNQQECLDNPSTVYSTNFTNDDIGGWSPYKTDSSSRGASTDVYPLLGRFGNQRVTLTVQNLEAHSSLYIGFELFIIGSWDGSYFNDRWGFDVDGFTIIQTTFDNWDFDNDSTHYQDFPVASSIPGAGAERLDDLSFIDTETGTVKDAVYRLCFRIPHSSQVAIIGFWASDLETHGPEFADESWGLGSISVATD